MIKTVLLKKEKHYCCNHSPEEKLEHTRVKSDLVFHTNVMHTYK